MKKIVVSMLGVMPVGQHREFVIEVGDDVDPRDLSAKALVELADKHGVAWLSCGGGEIVEREIVSCDQLASAAEVNGLPNLGRFE